MPDNQVIGGNIRLFRDRLGLSQEALAAFLETPREMVSYYENGSRTVPTDTLSRLADLFGIDPYDLLDSASDKKDAQLAFAFRAGEITPEALDVIARFKRIVINYIHMHEKLADESSAH